MGLQNPPGVSLAQEQADFAAAIASGTATYNGPVQLSSAKLVWQSGTVSNGVLTVHPTNDGTATGTALFKNVYGVMPSLAIDGNTYQFGAWSASADMKTVTINVTTAPTVKVATVSVLAAPVAATSGTIGVLLAGN